MEGSGYMETYFFFVGSLYFTLVLVEKLKEKITKGIHQNMSDTFNEQLDGNIGQFVGTFGALLQTLGQDPKKSL